MLKQNLISNGISTENLQNRAAETYKEVSTFGEELYDFETGEFIAENTQPVDNREIKKDFQNLQNTYHKKTGIIQVILIIKRSFSYLYQYK
ncbi:MAG: hypothetical protein ACLUUG_06850 [Lachnospiraceae bacterium]